MKLISDWKQAYKKYSIQMMGVALAVQGAWVTLPDDWRASVPSGVVSGITIVCLILGAIGRMIQQGQDESKPD